MRPIFRARLQHSRRYVERSSESSVITGIPFYFREDVYREEREGGREREEELDVLAMENYETRTDRWRTNRLLKVGEDCDEIAIIDDWLHRNTR